MMGLAILSFMKDQGAVRSRTFEHAPFLLPERGDDMASDEIELATLLDVPVLRAGKHHSHNAGEIEITEDEIDEIIEASQALAPLVKESFDTGKYRGNESLILHKMPGFINFVHDGILADTIKERTKGVNVEYGKKFFENPETGERVPWITQTFRDVPSDVAEAIKTRFPKRSVELIPFTNPDTGKSYRMAIRSTAAASVASMAACSRALSSLGRA